MEHELTHAKLRPKGETHWTDNLDDIRGNPDLPFRHGVTDKVEGAGSSGGDREIPVERRYWEYANSPEELKPYMAEIKRDYVKEFGRHVDTPQEAEKALEWWWKNKAGQRYPIGEIPMQKHVHENMSDEEKKVLIRQLMQIVGINPSGQFEHAAMDKYAALADFDCGDLTIKDRGGLGMDIHDGAGVGSAAGYLGHLGYNALKNAGDAGCGTLNVSAVGEGDYSKLRVCPFNTYGKDVLDEMDSRLNSQAKKSPMEVLKDMDIRDKDEASSEKCSADQNWLEKLAETKQADWINTLKGMDPTLKAGIGGAAVGGGLGGLAGAFGSLGGAGREAIDEETARKMLIAGVRPALVYKLLSPNEGDLSEEEIVELAHAGFNYDEVAPKLSYLGNMLGNTAKYGLIGAGTGGLVGAGVQEGARLLGGMAAPGVGADKAKSWIPNWAPDRVKGWGEGIGRSIGNQAWNSMSRQGQFDAVQDNLNFNLPGSIVDNALDKYESWRG
jgi:hypothetical protein